MGAGDLTFGVDDVPPPQITIFYALQVVMSIVSSPVSAAYIIHANLCADDDTVLLAKIISTTLVMCGVATFLQVTVGVRLPITQASSFMYFPAIIALMGTEKWKCGNDFRNGTMGAMNHTYRPEDQEPWRARILEISGALAVTSVFHMALGFTGLVGCLSRIIGPLTITPAVALISVMMYETISHGAKHNWGIALFTAGLAVLFAVILGDVQIPILSWNKYSGCHTVRYPLLRIFANILAIMGGWILCLVLTASGVLPEEPGILGYRARTDAKLSAIFDSSWVYFPYPGQWGWPTVSLSTVVALLPAVIGSTIESLGDYYATARVCGKLPIPRNAINRGIFVEGVCSVFSGLFGACHATTSYSQVAGFIAYTGMGSRVMWQAASLLFILGGVFGKFGAALAILPDPVVSGMMLVGLSMVFAVAIGNLETVNMRLSRNQMVLGLAMILGVTVPLYVKQELKQFDTGVPELDQVLVVVLSNGPIIGGVVGCLLDNLLPGTREERGMHLPENYSTVIGDASMGVSQGPNNATLPLGTRLRASRLCKYLPIMPGYEDPCTGVQLCPHITHCTAYARPDNGEEDGGVDDAEEDGEDDGGDTNDVYMEKVMADNTLVV